MEIYELLKRDHDKLKQLFVDLLSLHDGDKETRRFLLEQIREELVPHSRAEESVFYNSLRTINTLKDRALHGYKEHMEAETLLRMLQLQSKMNMDWKATAAKLKEALENHIRAEEIELFALAREHFTAEESKMMANAFEKLKPKIQEQNIIGTTWDMVANLMPPRFSDSFRGMKGPQL